MWKSDKNNINIGPDVRLKKMWCFHFFQKFVTVPQNGSHIIMKNHSEFRFFFSDDRMRPESFRTTTNEHGYFLVCSLRAMTVLWAVVCCVNACFCDSITLTASVLHDISHGQILYWFYNFWNLRWKDVFYSSIVNLTYPRNVQHKFCKSLLFRRHFATNVCL
jgi:hypothetical protein